MGIKLNQQIQDINTQETIHKFNIGNETCQIRIADTLVGKLNGEQVILDESLVESMLKGFIKSIKQNHSKYNKVPSEIIIIHEKQDRSNLPHEKMQQETNEYEVVESYSPKYSLEQVVLNEKVRRQMNTALAAIQNRKRLCDEWGMEEYFAKNRAIILNFYGEAGTGKSMTAEAIANSLGKKLYAVNYAELESKYVGETPKNIKRAFEKAKRDDAILIFDEADSFLGKRLTSVTQSSDYGVNITRSVLLIELEKFDGIVIFTTNMISNYDEAFKRRILANIKFELPDEQSRKKIWDIHINKKMPLEADITMDSLAHKYNNISGADIKDIVFFAGIRALELNSSVVTWDIFNYAYKLIRQRYQNNESKIKYEKIPQNEFEREIKEIGG